MSIQDGNGKRGARREGRPAPRTLQWRRREEATMTARNIVFDMGNVLMTFDGHEFARAFTTNEADAQALYEGLFGRVE